MKRMILLLLITAAAVVSAQTVQFNGQIRERSELDGRSFISDTKLDVYHLLRSRIGVNATLDEQISAALELQDARTFGQTRTTMNTGAPAFDLRQAYIDIRKIGGLPLGLRLGRQALGYANERLIGKIDWSNVGQSFDGAVASIGAGDVNVDLIGTAIARTPNTQVYNRDVFLAGVWGAWKPAESKASVQAFYLFDDPRTDSIRQNRHTAGLYTNGAVGGLDYEVDGAMQFGDYITGGEPSKAEQSISAYMLGARVGYTFADLAGFRFGIGYDRLSGHDPDSPDSYGAFNTLYATNHKFYGYMDFIDNVSQTRGAGVQDMFVQLSVMPSSAVKLSADLHQFALASDIGKIAPGSTFGQQIGRELDLTASVKASTALSITGGYSLFDGDSDRYVARGRKTTQWGYVMMTLGF